MATEKQTDELIEGSGEYEKEVLAEMAKLEAGDDQKPPATTPQKQEPDDKAQDAGPKQGEDQVSQLKAEIETLHKRLQDTQWAFHETRAELARLKKLREIEKKKEELHKKKPETVDDLQLEEGHKWLKEKEALEREEKELLEGKSQPEESSQPDQAGDERQFWVQWASEVMTAFEDAGLDFTQALQDQELAREFAKIRSEMGDGWRSPARAAVRMIRAVNQRKEAAEAAAKAAASRERKLSDADIGPVGSGGRQRKPFDSKDPVALAKAIEEMDDEEFAKLERNPSLLG